MNETIYSLFHKVALEKPKNVCIRFENRKWNYRQFDRMAVNTARRLLALGVKPGDVISTSIPNCPEAASLFYASNAIGAILYNIHPLTPPETLLKLLKRANSKVIFALWNNAYKIRDVFPSEYKVIGINPYFAVNPIKWIALSKMGESRKGLLKFHSLKKGKKKFTPYDMDPKADALYLNTGGTNGEPKIVRLSSFAVNALATQGYDLIGGDKEKIKLFLAIPLFHGFGLGMGLATPLSFGGSSVLLLKFSTKEAIKHIKKGHATVLLGVPAIYNALLSRKAFYGPWLKKQIVAYVGGDTAPSSLIERWNKAMEDNGSSARLYEGYGLTETVTCSNVNTFGEGRNKPGSIGKPLPVNRNKIVDLETGEELPPNTLGEILITGDTLMNGYFNDEKTTNETLIKDKDGVTWLHTKDYGYMDEDGFLYFKNRIKRVAKINGETLCPSDVENVIINIEGIYECYCYAVPDKKKGSIFRVAAVIRRGDHPLSKEEAKELIKKAIEEKLAPIYMPDKIIIMKKLPRTDVGKVNIKFFEENPDPQEID